MGQFDPREGGPEEPETYQEKVMKALASGEEIPDFPEASSMNELGILHNELYKGYEAAGFSEAQSLYMVAVFITGNPGIAPRA